MTVPGVTGRDAATLRLAAGCYRYLCNTSSRTDPNYLQAVDGPIGRCFHADWRIRRAYRYQPGHMNQLRRKVFRSGDRWRFRAGVDLILSGARRKSGEPMPDAT